MDLERDREGGRGERDKEREKRGDTENGQQSTKFNYKDMIMIMEGTEKRLRLAMNEWLLVLVMGDCIHGLGIMMDSDNDIINWNCNSLSDPASEESDSHSDSELGSDESGGSEQTSSEE
ncbi:hypothetical protein BJ165DRAFT_1406970 [Panaeolus papilionaceus]|nr:hypothetical protein BJ165DRAFT_1406970 [Panaeolus papilionaceus]